MCVCVCVCVCVYVCVLSVCMCVCVCTNVERERQVDFFLISVTTRSLTSENYVSDCDERGRVGLGGDMVSS